LAVRYLSIVGSDGSGKNHASLVVEAYLKSRGFDCLIVCEPGGTGLADELTASLKKNRNETVSANAELLLMSAARYQLLSNVVAPALLQNKIVISDRCWVCSDVYQRFSGNADPELFGVIKDKMLPVKPDAYILLDADPVLLSARVSGRGKKDRIESNGLEFFKNVREGYLLHASSPNFHVIDAEQSLEKVEQDLISLLEILF